MSQAKVDKYKDQKKKDVYKRQIQEGVDKGSAMRALEKRFNVKPEEIMAFGDNYLSLIHI